MVSEGKDPEVGRGLSCLRTGSEARPPGAQRVKVSLAQARSGDGGRGQACGVIARNLDFFFLSATEGHRKIYVLNVPSGCWGEGWIMSRGRERQKRKRKDQKGSWQPAGEHLQLPR